MPARMKAQLAMDEQVIEDADIEEALEQRLKAHEAVAEVRAVYDEADAKAKTELAKLELPVGAVARVGRFRITRVSVPPRSVTFETNASDRIKIGLIDDEG